MKDAIMVTDIKSATTFILEIWRERSAKLHATSMPAIGTIGDSRIELRRVPRYIRRSAKAILIPEREERQ